jgi:hypothetical protein
MIRIYLGINLVYDISEVKLVIKINSKLRKMPDKKIAEEKLMDILQSLYGKDFNFYYKNWFK